MNISHLIKYLKTDLAELSEIMNELAPNQTLSEMEIKLIKSRIRSLNEEFIMLQEGLSGASIQNTNDINKQEDSARAENNQHQTPETDTENTEKYKNQESSKPQKTETSQKNTTNTETSESAGQETAPQPAEETTQVPENQQQESDIESIEEEPYYTQETEQPKSQTIADKYTGSSNSLHERIATHISQNDLASKLQQNPINDLTKAIKLNDKIWFINDLFNGDADLYKETIHQINQMNDFDDVLTFLEESYNFDQEKDSFKSFIEFIYRRFLK